MRKFKVYRRMFLACGAALLSGSFANASWTNPAGGSWETLTNWTGGTPDGVFNLGSTTGYTVTLGANESAFTQVQNDKLTIDLGTHTLDSSQFGFSVGGTNGNSADVTVTGQSTGMLTMYGGIGVGTTGAVGSLSISNVGITASHGGVGVAAGSTFHSQNFGGKMASIGNAGTATFDTTTASFLLSVQLTGNTTMTHSTFNGSPGMQAILGGTFSMTSSSIYAPGGATLSGTGSMTNSGLNFDGNAVSINGGTLTMSGSNLGGFPNVPSNFSIAASGGAETLNATASSFYSLRTFVGGGGGNANILLDTASSWVTHGDVSLGVNSGGVAGTANLTLDHASTWAITNYSNNFYPGSFTLATGGTVHLNRGASISSESMSTVGDMEFGLSGSATTQYGRFVDSGAASLGGNLGVVLLDGFVPAPGMSFDLLDFTTETGTFANVNLPILPVDESWNTSQLYSTGVISVVPEPASLSVTALGGLALLRRRKRA